MKPITEFFRKEKPLPLGIHHQVVTTDEGDTYRLHLRIDEGGDSVLSINASRILHLNGTATEFAKLIMEGKSKDEAVKAIRKRYRIGRKIAEADYDRLFEIIESMSRAEDICPITYLDLKRIEPFATPTTAPYRMDLAVTYRCNNDCSHCYARQEKNVQELPTESWNKILQKLWEIGIFHVAFTGGEATLRDDLAELIGIAEDLGMVSGLLTNGRKLSDKKYIASLIGEGIDYFQVTLESSDKDIHNQMVGADAFDETVAGIKNAARSPIHTITNTTITKYNVRTLSDTVDFVASLGVDAFAMNGIIYTGGAESGEMAIAEDDLFEILETVVEAADRNDLRFIWYTPTQYCRFNPLELDIGIKQCTAGKFNMCIEPNGDALPCQSYYEPVGNILTDDWEKIWNHPLLISLRRREFLMDKCGDCDLLGVCGGGCPLELKSDTYLCSESMSNP
jgi:radical SAM protein with 4Fe4S-binding SPASM domain